MVAFLGEHLHNKRVLRFPEEVVCGGLALTGHCQTLLTIHILISAVFFSSDKSKPVQQCRRAVKTRYYNWRIITSASELALILSFFMTYTQQKASMTQQTVNLSPPQQEKAQLGLLNRL